MAPEQARSGNVSCASDIFALGAPLMFAGWGRPPFGEGGSTEVLFRVVHEPPDLSALQEVDTALYDLVASCLHKDSGQRPDAAEVVAAARERAEGAGWPGPLQDRIAPRAALAAKASLSEPAALSCGETSLGDGGGLPRRALVPAPPARRRGRLVLAAALAVACLAGAASRRACRQLARSRPHRPPSRSAATRCTATWCDPRRTCRPAARPARAMTWHHRTSFPSQAETGMRTAGAAGTVGEPLPPPPDRPAPGVTTTPSRCKACSTHTDTAWAVTGRTAASTPTPARRCP
ncbi:protein kinase [Streptomyces sp. 900105755]